MKKKLFLKASTLGSTPLKILWLFLIHQSSKLILNTTHVQAGKWRQSHSGPRLQSFYYRTVINSTSSLTNGFIVECGRNLFLIRLSLYRGRVSKRKMESRTQRQYIGSPHRDLMELPAPVIHDKINILWRGTWSSFHSLRVYSSYHYK